MAKIPKLDNTTNLGLHLTAGLSDEYLTEAQYILDDTQTEKQGKQVSIQDTLDNLKQTTQNFVNNDDIDDMFTVCNENNHDIPEDENTEDTNDENIAK